MLGHEVISTQQKNLHGDVNYFTLDSIQFYYKFKSNSSQPY